MQPTTRENGGVQVALTALHSKLRETAEKSARERTPVFAAYGCELSALEDAIRAAVELEGE